MAKQRIVANWFGFKNGHCCPNCLKQLPVEEQNLPYAGVTEHEREKYGLEVCCVCNFALKSAVTKHKRRLI